MLHACSSFLWECSANCPSRSQSTRLILIAFHQPHSITEQHACQRQPARSIELRSGAALSDQVVNPDYLAGGPGIIGQSTVARSQTLRPFPQFTSVNLFVSSSHAAYGALPI
jgi:hypothetical protein